MATMFFMPLEPRIKAGIVSAWFNHRLTKMAVSDKRYSSFIDTAEEHAFLQRVADRVRRSRRHYAHLPASRDDSAQVDLDHVVQEAYVRLLSSLLWGHVATRNKPSGLREIVASCDVTP